MKNKLLKLSSIVIMLTCYQIAKSQSYLRFERTTGGVLTTLPPLNAVEQSSGTVATTVQMNDLSFSTGAITTNMVNAWVSVDMGSERVISYVDLGAQSSVTNLNGRSIQVSTDNSSWTTVVNSITGASTSVLVRYYFAAVNARYVRVFNPAVTSGVVGVSEFIPETVSNRMIAAGQGNVASRLLDIGFDFSFKGANYTRFSVNSNGLMRLGNTVVTTEYANVTRSVTNTPKLFALWDDLATAASGNNGGVWSVMTGTTPNRVLSVHFVCSRTNASGTADFTYQIRLHESTGRIEYVYGANLSSPASASIGLGGTNPQQDFISVVDASATAKISYHNFNDNLTVWPGNGTVFSFTPTNFNASENIPSANFASIENAVGALNWAGGTTATGGTVFTVAGGHEETAPNAITVAPVVPAGILLRAKGTAVNPIEFTWDGSGVKPIIRSGTGAYDWDYIFGLAGVSYVKMDGLDLRDNPAHTTNPQRAEIGFGLFKERYNITQGNVGCNNVEIVNCNITLTRLPNNRINDDLQNHRQHHFSRGIFVTHFTNTHAGPYNDTYGTRSSNHYQGILSEADVHRNCKLTGNEINECTYGIEISDGWRVVAGNVVAGTNNIVGEYGAGNTITNWGAATDNTIYATSAFNGGTLMAGIIVGGQKDFTIEHNTVQNGQSEHNTTSYIQNFVGILAGRTSCNQDWPHFAPDFFMNIRHNTISGINAAVTNAAGVGKSALGIVVLQTEKSFGNSSAYTAVGDIDISNNTISGLVAGVGNVRGITSSMRLYLSYKNSFGVDNLWDWSRFWSNGTVTISGNTITDLKQNNLTASNATNKGSLVGIAWTYPTKRVIIENNTIGGAGTDEIREGLTTNNFLNDHVIGLRGIYVDAIGVNVPVRDTVRIANNTITNLNRVAGTITANTSLRTSGAGAILIYRGATHNIVENNTISNLTIANGLYQAVANNQIDVIRVFGQPKVGASTVKISKNTITDVTRNQFGQPGGVMTLGSGLHAYTSAIHADYTGGIQIKTIDSNVIENITQTVTYAPTAANEVRYFSQLYGIKVRGRNTAGSIVNIHGNSISDLSGDNWNRNGMLSTVSINQYTTAWNVVGINVADYQRLNIYDNTICRLATSATGGTTNHTSAYGVVGISFGKSGAGAAANASTLGEAVYNNIISELTAPNINSLFAVQGIYYWGYGRFARIVHNTIVLGNPDGQAGGRLQSSTANSFGVSGVSLNNYYWNNRLYPIHFYNNLISVNATGKGSTGATAFSNSTTGGFVTAWRHLSHSSARRSPLGLESNSGGNVYFVNEGVRNYIYGQGWGYWSISNGLINAFGYGAVTPPTVDLTRNIQNDYPVFNEQCGRYKSFWGSKEKSSFIDIDGSNDIQPLPFVNSGSGCSDRLQLINSANSYAGSALRYNNLLNVDADFFGTNRGVEEVVAGAHENPTVNGPDIELISFSYIPVCDGVCTGNKEITVTIKPPAGKTIATQANTTAPRIYFRRVRNSSLVSAAQSDDNVMVDIADNHSGGTEGWRWVEPHTISGDDYTFEIDESLLSNTMPTISTYSIEYFVIAMTEDGLVTGWTSGDFSAAVCPSTVDLFSINGAAQIPADYDGDVSLDENTVGDIYTVCKGSDITKELEVVNNLTTYTVDNSTALEVCLNDTLFVKGHFSVLGEHFDDGCVVYKFEVADNTGFSTNLEVFTSTANVFKYQVTGTSTKYIRASLDCGGTTPANTVTAYKAFVGIECPSVTSDITFQQPCEGTNMSLTATRSGGTGDGNGFLFIDPYGKAYPSITTLASPAATNVGPVDTTQNGVWKVIGIREQTALGTTRLQGINYTDLLSDAGEESGDAVVNKGLLFDVKDPVRIHSVTVRDAGGDEETSTGFNVQILDSTGHVIFNHVGPASVSNNGTSTLTFSNCYIPPGNNYMMVLAEKTEGVDPTGELAVVPGEFPYVVTNGALTIKGGVEDLDYQHPTTDYNYFFSWNLTLYCASNNEDTFHVRVREFPRIEEEGMSDTLIVCEGEPIQFAPEATRGEALTYEWWKHVSGSIWNSVSGQKDSVFFIANAAPGDAGKYRLHLGAGCGSTYISKDTVVVFVNSSPAKPVVSDVTTCGVNVNNIEISSTQENTWWYYDMDRTNLFSVGDQLLIGPLSVNDTLFAFNFNDSTGCFSMPDTASIDFVNLFDIPSAIGEHRADAVCVDDSNWAHYYRATDKQLIFSIKLDPAVLGSSLVTSGWNSSSSDYEVVVGVEAGRKFLSQGHPRYVQSPEGWHVIGRYWKVHTNEPDFTGETQDIPVQMYFHQSDFDDLNTAPLSLGGLEDMIFYKLPHGHNPGTANHDNADKIDTFSITESKGGSLTHYSLDSFNAVSNKVVVSAFHVKGFSGGGGGAGGFSLLSVSWLSVDAQWIDKNKASVEWKVANETDVQKYEVLKSYGTTDFYKIGEVLSGGNSHESRQYSFIDNYFAENSPHYYYRIRQIDWNGNTSESKIAVLKNNVNVLSNPVLFAFYPNPADNELIVTINTHEEQGVNNSVKIINVHGQVVLDFNGLNKGANKLSIDGLAQGTYFLSMTSNDVTEIKKLIIVK